MNTFRITFATALILMLVTISCKSTQSMDTASVSTESPSIKSKTTYKIYPDDEQGTLLEKQVFNQSGQIIMFYAYDFYGSGEIEDSTTYQYDGQGQKVKEFSYGNSTTTTFAYNDQGKILEETWSRPNGQGETAKYAYNGSGDLVEIKYFTPKGDYDFSRTFELGYDRKGRVIEEKKWEKYTDGSADMLMYHMKYEYNSSDDILVKERLNEDAQVDNRTEFTYDEQGRLILEVDITILDGVEQEREKTVYHLNKSGKTVKDESFSVYQGKESLNYTNRYRYNKYGHQEWMMYEHADGTDSWGERVEYEYY